MTTISCPSCNAKLQLPPSATGKQVRCPKCQHVFLVPAPAAPIPTVPVAIATIPIAPAPISSPAPQQSPPPVRTERWDNDRDRREEGREVRPRERWEDLDDDRYDEDSRRRRSRDDRFEDDDARSRRVRKHENAKAALGGPGIGLMVASIIGMICPVIALVRVASQGAPRNANPDFMVGYVIGLSVAVAVPFIWACCLLLGANAVRSASNRGMIIFACVVSFLPCNWMWPLSLGMGIWALVVYNNPEVNEGIR